MRCALWFAGAILLTQALGAQAPEAAGDPVVVFLKIEELDPKVAGKTKVLAEPELLINLGKSVSFNSGREVPVKTPLGGGLESIDYVTIGPRLELTCMQKVEGSIFVDLVTESVHLVEDRDGLFATRSTKLRKRGRIKLGKAYRTEPIKVEADSERSIRFEFRLELAGKDDLDRIRRH